MISIRPFQPEHLKRIGNPQHDLLSLGSVLTDRYGQGLKAAGPAFTGFDADGPIACAGLILYWPGVASAWAYLGENRFHEHRFSAHRAVKRGLDQLIKDYNLHRVQTEVAEDDERAQRWARGLGFVYEGRMPMFGAHRETYLRYARLIDD